MVRRRIRAYDSYDSANQQPITVALSENDYLLPIQDTPQKARTRKPEPENWRSYVPIQRNRIIFADRPAYERRSNDLTRESWSYHSLFPSMRTFIPLLLMPVIASVLSVFMKDINPQAYAYFWPLAVQMAIVFFFAEQTKARVSHFVKDGLIHAFVLAGILLMSGNLQTTIVAFSMYLGAHLLMHAVDFHVERDSNRVFRLALFGGFLISMQIILGAGIATLIACILFSVAMRSFVIVKQNEKGLLFRYGKLLNGIEPGLSFLFPVIDVVAIIDRRIHTIDMPAQKVITEDNANVGVEVTIYYRVMDAQKIVLNVAGYETATINLCQTTLRSIVGSIYFDNLNSERETINQTLRTELESQGNAWGIQFTHVEIGRVIPLSRSLNEALMQEVKAEREKRAAILESEGSKASSVIQAEGYRTAIQTVAEGMGIAKVNVANGDAQGMRIVADEAKRITGSALSLWELGMWKTVSSGKNTSVVLPYDLGGFVKCMKGIEGK